MTIPPLTDGEILLRLRKETPANPAKEWVRALHYDIILPATSATVGEINLRLGYTLALVRYGGNIGYGINQEWRGHHFAGKACKILKAVVIANGMDVIWITCNPDNWASRKTCEWIGATLVEIADLPPENDQYKLGDRQKCRYRWLTY